MCIKLTVTMIFYNNEQQYMCDELKIHRNCATRVECGNCILKMIKYSRPLETFSSNMYSGIWIACNYAQVW